MTITGLDTVDVVVSDKKCAISWYRDVLGLRLAYIGPSKASSAPTIEGTPEDPGHWIEMGVPRSMTRLHLCELEDHHKEPGATGITFITDDILGDYERLKAKRVRFLSRPKKMERGEWLSNSSTKMETSLA